MTTPGPGKPDEVKVLDEVKVNIAERGANGQTSNRRLFMLLQAFGGCYEPKALAAALKRSRIEAALYADLQDPRGVGVLTFAEDPAFLVTRAREVLGGEPFAGLAQKPELTMIGRTYSSGFEPDLEDWLLSRPRRTVLNPDWPWAVWYPLRRTGAFAKLSAQEQGAILREHGTVGRAYGDADLTHDIRLACHGLDAHDNDFLIGLVGKELQPLSHLVQAMRKTVQTSQYMASLGPFFVGYAIWQSPLR